MPWYQYSTTRFTYVEPTPLPSGMSFTVYKSIYDLVLVCIHVCLTFCLLWVGVVRAHTSKYPVWSPSNIRIPIRGGGRGGGAFAPPSWMFASLDIYCIVQHVALAPPSPGMRKQLFCPPLPPLSKILNAALPITVWYTRLLIRPPSGSEEKKVWLAGWPHFRGGFVLQSI